MTVGAHVFTGVDPDLHFKEILYLSDFSPGDAAAAPYAVFLGRAFQAPVDVCQLLTEAIPINPVFWQDVAQEYCDAIRQAYPRSESHWDKPAFHLDRSATFDDIIDRAQTLQAGLIVLGAHSESQLGRHLHTSFAYQLLSKATCPVISVRPAAAQSS